MRCGDGLLFFCAFGILVSLPYYFTEHPAKEYFGRRRLGCHWVNWANKMQCDSKAPTSPPQAKSQLVNTTESHASLPASALPLALVVPKVVPGKPSLGKVTGRESPGSPWPHSINASQSLNWLDRTVLLVGPTHAGREALLSLYEPHVASLVHVFVSPSTENALKDLHADCKCSYFGCAAAAPTNAFLFFFLRAYEIFELMEGVMMRGLG